jgi:pimeloyl-ACP methyl ester carboxylesterase
VTPRRSSRNRAAPRNGGCRAPAPPFFFSRRAFGTVTVDDLAYLYLDLLAEQDCCEVVVIGCSLGGWIAAEMAVRCTDRLGRLVLVGPLGIKVGDRETRDIPNIFALHPDEVEQGPTAVYQPAGLSPDGLDGEHDESGHGH